VSKNKPNRQNRPQSRPDSLATQARPQPPAPEIVRPGGLPATRTPQAIAAPGEGHGDRQPGQARIFSYEYSGPLPPPELLRQYEEIVPGLAKEFGEAFVRQGKHRQRMEWNHLIHGIIRSYAGLVAGLIIVLAFGYLAFLTIMAGHEVPGTIFGTVDLVALAGVFVYGYQKVTDDLAEKRKRAEQLKQPQQPQRGERSQSRRR
jgi:uncharacterized membrane protein